MVKRNLAIFGERKKDKMLARNSDSLEKHNPLLKTKEDPIFETDPDYIFCERCKKQIPRWYWNDHKKNHMRLGKWK